MSLMSKLSGTEAIEHDIKRRKKILNNAVSFVIRNPLLYDSNTLTIAYRIKYTPISLIQDERDMDNYIERALDFRKSKNLKSKKNSWWKFWK